MYSDSDGSFFHDREYKLRINLTVGNFLISPYELRIKDIFVREDIKIKEEIQQYFLAHGLGNQWVGGWEDDIVLEAIEYVNDKNGNTIKFSNGDQSIPIANGKSIDFDLIISGDFFSNDSYDDPNAGISSSYPLYEQMIIHHSREIISKLFVVIDKPFLAVDKIELQLDTLNILIGHYKSSM